MQAESDRFKAVIPMTYTQAAYALQYFFELRDGAGRAWFYPGFARDLRFSDPPYFVVRQG